MTNIDRPTRIKGIVISVGDHYASLLRVTLAMNMRHLAECLVVTAPGDPSLAVARGIPGVRTLETDAFTRYGASFNKGLAMEEGFDALGRSGWILIWDADILMPEDLGLEHARADALNGATRRMAPESGRHDVPWGRYPPGGDVGPIGFFQLFHADADPVRGRRPWYDPTFAHAGGGDAFFLWSWPRASWNILPIRVLHFGEKDRNWFGVSPGQRDVMSAFVHRNGWRSLMGVHDREAVRRVGTIVDRVHVPGYTSTFSMPGIAHRWNTPEPPPRVVPLPSEADLAELDATP